MGMGTTFDVCTVYFCKELLHPGYSERLAGSGAVNIVRHPVCNVEVCAQAAAATAACEHACSGSKGGIEHADSSNDSKNLQESLDWPRE